MTSLILFSFWKAANIFMFSPLLPAIRMSKDACLDVCVCVCVCGNAGMQGRK